MLMDKGYYDYDYKVIEVIASAYGDIEGLELPSDDNIQRRIAKFGIGKYANKKQDLKSMSAEELQSHAMKELENK